MKRQAVGMPPLLTLPDCLLNGSNASAQELLDGYLADADVPGGVAFTGSLFDSWDGGGDREGVADAFTNADLVAVSFLSIQVPPETSIEIVGRQGAELSALLAVIPHTPLDRVTESVVGPGSHADRLWRTLTQIHGVGWVTASKLLARKRPHLLPVYDEIVKQVVGAPESYWLSLRQTLIDQPLVLERIQELSDATGLSILRTFDVLCWREGKAKGLR